MLSDAPTAYALALEFNLLPEPSQRQHAARRLVELVRAGGYRIATGFVGTPLMCDALSNSGAYHAAYRLLLQTECPSWLYSVTMGATTIWERWDSMLPDGSINPGEMTSFNHYALGAVADWLHRTVAGLAPAEPGYRRLTIRPRPGGGITSAAARHHTPYGMAACTWRIEAGQIDVTLVVPPNTTADVTLPGSNTAPLHVGSGEHHWAYTYQDPDARAPLGLDDLVGDIVDDAPTWQLVVAAIKSAAPGNPFLLGMLQSQSRMPLRKALTGVPQATTVLAAVEAALTNR
jgi:alpha-L-rhamnosidase